MKPRVLAALARIGFQNLMAFRLRYYTGVVTYLVNVSVYYFLWRAVFRESPGFGGFEFPQMITYVAVGWLLRSVYFNNIDVELADDIQQGKVAMTMLLPVPFFVTYLARVLGEAAFRLVLLCAPACVVLALVFPLQAPASALHLAAFGAAGLASVLIVASLNFIVGLLAFVSHSILGLLRAKFWLQDLFSGLVAPMVLFPEPVRQVSAWLPFEHIGYTPLMIYLGKINGGDLGRALLAMAVWVVLLLAGAACFWRWMSRKITVHGG